MNKISQAETSRFRVLSRDHSAADSLKRGGGGELLAFVELIASGCGNSNWF